MATKPEPGTTSYSKNPEHGTSSSTQVDDNSTQTSGNGSGSGGNGGGSSSGGSDQDTNQQIKNLGTINLYRKGDLDKISSDRMGDINDIAANRLADMDKTAQEQFANIDQQRQQNLSAYQARQGQIERNVQWQPAEQKKQSMLMQLRNRMGNAAYGSNLQDLLEGLQRVDDMSDVSLIQAWKENQDAAFSDYRKSDDALVSDWNSLITSLMDQFSQFEADYNDQYSKQLHDYEDKTSQQYVNYLTSLSNLSPKTMAKATKYSDSKAVADAANALVKKSNGKKVSTKGLTGIQKQAANLVNDIIKANKGKKASDIKKAVAKAASQYTKAASTADKLKNNATMPSKIDLSRSDELNRLMTRQQNISAINDRTASLVRSPESRIGVQPGGNNGIANLSRAANSGFGDNLAAFRR